MTRPTDPDATTSAAVRGRYTVIVVPEGPNEGVWLYGDRMSAAALSALTARLPKIRTLAEQAAGRAALAGRSELSVCDFLKPCVDENKWAVLMAMAAPDAATRMDFNHA